MSEFVFTNKLNFILLAILSYVTTTGTATVTNRSNIFYKEQCLCSNYVFSEKLSILDCFWATISWSRSVVLDKTNESFSFPLNLEYSSNFSAIFNASRSELISGSPTVSSSSSPPDVFDVQFTSCGFYSFEAKSLPLRNLIQSLAKCMD